MRANNYMKMDNFLSKDQFPLLANLGLTKIKSSENSWEDKIYLCLYSFYFFKIKNKPSPPANNQIGFIPKNKACPGSLVTPP